MTNNPNNILIYSPYDVDLDNSNFNWQRFCEQLELAPTSIKELIFNLNTALFLRNNIAHKFSLNHEQSISLSRVLRDVLIAEIYLGDLNGQLKERLGITEEVAKEIAAITLNQLFAPILEELRSMHKTRFKREDPVSDNGQATTSHMLPPPTNPNNVLDLSKKNNP